MSGYVNPNGVANVETWNGSSWTEVADVNTAVYGHGGAGNDNTSSLKFTGSTPGGETTNVETWNGSAWTETTNMSRSSYQVGFCGTTPSALAFGGSQSNSDINYTEEWVGPGAPIGAWSTGGNLNTARQSLGGAGASSIAALAFGGGPPGVAITESYDGTTWTGKPDTPYSYDGTSWTEVNNLNTGRAFLGGTGTQTAALAFGGEGPPISTATEVWNGTNWATSPGTLNTARNLMAESGTSTSALAFGGEGPPNLAVTESWNGTSWTEVNDLNTARRNYSGSGASNTEGLAIGGYVTTNIASVESYNGTNWTEVGDINTARRGTGASGTPLSTIVFGGYSTAASALTEDWNGATWAEVADLTTARAGLAAASQSTTSSVTFGGNNPSPVTAATEEWSSTSNVVKTLTD